MLKYVFILALIFGGAVFVARQDKRAAQKSAQKSAHLNGVTTAASTNAEYSQTDIENAERNGPSWYSIFRWPTGTTTLAIVLTLLAIAEQSSEIRKSTQATANNERAWILVTMGDIPKFTPTYDGVLEMLYIAPILKNFGRTPAIITKVRAKSERVATGFKLPPEADYETIYTQKVDYEFPLPPDHSIQPVKVGIATHDFVPVFSREMIQYIRGFVDYRDIGGNKHVTEFSFVYHVPAGMNVDPQGFYLGPPEYNNIS